jgi:hypothetical protein
MSAITAVASAPSGAGALDDTRPQLATVVDLAEAHRLRGLYP